MATGTRRWPSLLTVAQAAQMIDRDENTVRIYLRRGVLHGRKSAGAYVLARDEVLADISRHERTLKKGTIG
ncbi:helix-turn-helix domain-containing protein [Luteimicrobium sp. DT211]|uniref:helix-turn-helix domain-containing protein n=1 Tax=Luteimicrobium sp. DT211 TaxID=3393412 RepID=UPI003CEDBCDC